MAIYHTKLRNTGLSAGGNSYEIDGEGRISPDPDPVTAHLLLGLANYRRVDEAPAPVAAPVVEAKEDPKPKPKPPKRKRTKKTRAKKAETED